MQMRIKKGFSLGEMLVALSISAIVAVIAVPVYQAIQSKVAETVAAQMADQVNKTYQEWKAGGGTVTGTPVGSVILSLLSGQNDSGIQPYNCIGGGCTATDPTGPMPLIRVSLPPGTLSGISSTNETNYMAVPGTNSPILTYSAASDKFNVISSNNVNWTLCYSTPQIVDMPTPYGYALNNGGLTSSTIESPDGAHVPIVTFTNNSPPVSGTSYAYDSSTNTLWRADYDPNGVGSGGYSIQVVNGHFSYTPMPPVTTSQTQTVWEIYLHSTTLGTH